DVRTDRGARAHHLAVVDPGVVHGGDVHQVSARRALYDGVTGDGVDAAIQVRPVGLVVHLAGADLAADRGACAAGIGAVVPGAVLTSSLRVGARSRQG